MKRGNLVVVLKSLDVVLLIEFREMNKKNQHSLTLVKSV